jgi:hypothetical protein
MALNLTGLPDYVSQKSKEFVKDAVLGAQTIKLLQSAGSVQFGIKSKSAINTLGVSVNVQSDLDCARNPIGDTTIGQAVIEVHPLKDEQNYCPKKYENKWTGDYLTKGSTYTELLFAQDFMTERAAGIAKYNEDHVWQGNATGATAYNKYDGFVKLIKASAAQNVTVSGATIVEKLQSLFMAAPKVTSTSTDAKIFIGTDKYQEYVMAMAAKNLYSPTADKTLFGTLAQLEPVNGLIGQNFAVYTLPKNLIYGTDMVDEEESATMDYSIETKQIYVDFHWKSGVQIVKGSEMAYATI